MPSAHGHKHSSSVTQNRKAQLANAYNELGKELSSNKIRVIGNYTLGKVIGEGSYGKVRLGTHRLTSTRVAIKQIPKAMSSSLTREIHHHRQLHHPHITQMYEVIATESHIWIVTELCCGGELFDYLVEKTRLTEDEARVLFGQLCLAVAHLHNNGIVHRDLKLENVLLDERCRVKLGDFGFTREFEKGSFMETFCGTTGYAAPEMLQGKKYQGPEVDVWSLGVILYCLLTGALPFDDDDEDVMKSMIIKGDFEDPDWLSLESRDLIKHILVQDPNARFTIPQILEHTWFTKRDLTYEICESPITPGSLPFPSTHLETIPSEAGSNSERPSLELPSTEGSSSLNTSTSSSDVDTSSPTTPADDDPFLDYKPSSTSPTQTSPRATGLHRNPSESTIRKGNGPSEFDSLYSKMTTGHQHPETVQEEGEVPSPPRLASASSGSTTSKTAPPAHAIRTPARTKRRSVSSALSVELGNDEKGSPGIKEKSLPPLPNANGRDNPMNFSSLLSTPTPIIFSTPLERQLLNSLSILGFDTAQLVHSVLNDACDAAGAVWWMVKKKAEANGGLGSGFDTPTTATYPTSTFVPPSAPGQTTEKDRRESGEKSPSKRRKHFNTGTQTEAQYFTLNAARSAPQLAFVPPTPTIPTHGGRTTPPRPVTPTRSSATLLSPSDASSKSHPSTPSSSVREKSERESGLHGSLRDKDWGKKGEGRKNRSGSVSIMQRVTTGLEAAGLVRKKSSEAVREKEERKEREKSRETERKMSGGTTSYGEDSRTSHSSHSSSKLTKSPPLKPTLATGKDHPPLPSTPPPSEKQQQHYFNHVQAHVGNSPWVLAEVGTTRKLDVRTVTASRLSASDSASATAGHNHNIPPTPSNTPGEWPTSPTTFVEGESGAYRPPQRNRQSLLSAIKFWLHTEDKKGKRKDSGGSSKSTVQPGPSGAYQPGNQGGYNTGTVKRRGSSGGGRFNVRSGHRQRPSNSSRRSSSVASRRSSGASMQIPSAAVMDSPQIPTRRSFGSHTPNSDRGEYPSRPSSVVSFSMQTRHRQSPSQSSVSSMRLRTASPMGKYHRRLGSGSSSTTRVVRHHAHRERHVRSDSTTSSLYSPTSSRPPSFYELSENEGGLSKTSPNKRRKSIEETPRKGAGGNSMTATFVAQKRTAPFASPAVHGSIGRSSWKKSWGVEPPGWQSRTAHLPVEILAISPSNEPLSLRDVFTGRPSLSMGDESDWVDEDDDIPAFIGGLGQMSSASSSNSNSANEPTITLSPAPRGHGHRSTGSRGSNRASGSGPVVNGSSRQKSAGHSPIERLSPVPMETTQETRGGGRRQLPNTRAGPAFKQAIQEEDEDEEE